MARDLFEKIIASEAFAYQSAVYVRNRSNYCIDRAGADFGGELF
jgi:hypothetical protein